MWKHEFSWIVLVGDDEVSRAMVLWTWSFSKAVKYLMADWSLITKFQLRHILKVRIAIIECSLDLAKELLLVLLLVFMKDTLSGILGLYTFVLEEN